jgi:hypothetical protein
MKYQCYLIRINFEKPYIKVGKTTNWANRKKNYLQNIPENFLEELKFWDFENEYEMNTAEKNLIKMIDIDFKKEYSSDISPIDMLMAIPNWELVDCNVDDYFFKTKAVYYSLVGKLLDFKTKNSIPFHSVKLQEVEPDKGQKEREVLELYEKGFSYQQICDKLNYKSKTSIFRIIQKLKFKEISNEKNTLYKNLPDYFKYSDFILLAKKYNISESTAKRFLSDCNFFTKNNGLYMKINNTLVSEIYEKLKNIYINKPSFYDILERNNLIIVDNIWKINVASDYEETLVSHFEQELIDFVKIELGAQIEIIIT